MINETYTDEEGNTRPYTLAEYLYDTDPGWRKRMSDDLVKRILRGGYLSCDEAERYLVELLG